MKRMLLILLLGLTACSGSATPTATLPPVPVTVATFTPPPLATVTPVAQPTPRASAQSLPTPSEPVNLTVTAADQAQLAATFYPPAIEKAPGILLLHTLDSVGGCACRKDWDSFARELQKLGYAVLAFDFRGHGDSPGPEDWVNKAPGDVLAAWGTLLQQTGVDREASGAVGASIGANLALMVGSNNQDMKVVIALSPGEDYHGLRPLGVLSNFTPPPVRPVLLAASAEDTDSYNSVQKMAAQFPMFEPYYLANAGHGTAMLGDASFVQFLFMWLETHLAILKG